MEMIIRLILKIFTEIFEADSRQRQSSAAPPPHQVPPNQKKQGQQGQAQQEQQPLSPLEAFLRELQGLDEPQAEPRTQGPTKKSGPRPAGYQQQAMHRAYRDQHRERETLEEHLRHREAEIARMEKRAREMERQAAEHLGLKLRQKKQEEKGFQLPGQTPLEQLMYAQVILGPCKAQQRQARI